jgi:transitional endoplasmic reticulum ATPase
MASFFGQEPPRFIAVPTGPNETTEVPWGNFEVPLLEDTYFMTGGVQDEDLGPLFRVQVSCPRKLRPQVEGIFILLEAYLAEHSLYRGKAFNGGEMPEFLDLSLVDPEKVAYSEMVTAQLEANIWAVLRHAESLRDAGLPLKRAVLLHGPYGTGKTLAGLLTARIAVESGWTFIHARPGKDDVRDVLRTASLYAPAVVFAEDLDGDGRQHLRRGGARPVRRPRVEGPGGHHRRHDEPPGAAAPGDAAARSAGRAHRGRLPGRQGHPGHHRAGAPPGDAP